VIGVASRSTVCKRKPDSTVGVNPLVPELNAQCSSACENGILEGLVSVHTLVRGGREREENLAFFFKFSYIKFSGLFINW
jgi:hypothetical protein